MGFKEILGKTKHTNLTPLIAEEFFQGTFERIQDSHQKQLANVIGSLNAKINQI